MSRLRWVVVAAVVALATAGGIVFGHSSASAGTDPAFDSGSRAVGQTFSVTFNGSGSRGPRNRTGHRRRFGPALGSPGDDGLVDPTGIRTATSTDDAVDRPRKSHLPWQNERFRLGVGTLGAQRGARLRSPVGRGQPL